MSQEYDKERTAALIKEARDITAHLKVETEMIKTEMESVLEGPNADFLDELDRDEAALDTSIMAEVVPRKPFWRLRR